MSISDATNTKKNEESNLAVLLGTFDLGISGFLLPRCHGKCMEGLDQLAVSCIFGMAVNSLWVGIGALRGEINALQK